MSLEGLGWNGFFAAAFASLDEPDLVPARIVEQRGTYGVATGTSELQATLAGSLRHQAEGAIDLPVVGDWVALRTPLPREAGEQALIRAVLPRRSCFSRRAAGRRTERQAVAANVETAFLVSGLDGDFNPRRIERYLTAAWDSGARPVLVLNKADRTDDPAARLGEAEAVALGVPALLVSALTGEGLPALAPYLRPGETVAFLGSSGVGKSTLVNRLLGGDLQRIREVRAGDDRGRHTTTHRQLFAAPEGWLLIDTPGMRELQLWEGEEGMATAFADVEELARRCAFRDCRHAGEPGCAVEQGVRAGALAAERLASFRKLQGEVERTHAAADVAARLREKQRAKALQRAYRRDFPKR